MTFDEQVWQIERRLYARRAAELFESFVLTISELRHPLSGCPWDLEQTHSSLRRFMLEEAYEAVEAMASGDSKHLIEELGDVMLQVVLNAQILFELREGDLRSIVDGINQKILRRHPHVFASQGGQKLQVLDVKKAWEKIKQEEKRGTEKVTSLFADCKKINPALTQAYRIGKKAKAINFDWLSADDVLTHLYSELAELKVELANGDIDSARKELGDIFFTLSQLSRHLDLEPELAAYEGNLKFLKRFELVETIAQTKGLSFSALTQSELEELWREAKEKEELGK